MVEQGLSGTSEKGFLFFDLGIGIWDLGFEWSGISLRTLRKPYVAFARNSFTLRNAKNSRRSAEKPKQYLYSTNYLHSLMPYKIHMTLLNLAIDFP